MKNTICILLLWLQFQHVYGEDSIAKRHLKLPSQITYSSNLSGSYIAYKNWKYNGTNNFAFLIRENINYDSIGSLWETHLRFNGELGYMKFVDSAWYKNSDYLDLSLEVVKSKSKNITNTFTFYFNSQFLSTYENYVNDSGLYISHWAGGFGNPMCIDLAYGSTVKFWKTCRLNLNYINLRTTTNPYLEDSEPILSTDFKYKKTIIRSEYGFSFQVFLHHNLNSRIRIENYSRCFANAISANHFDMDLRNKFVFKLLKYLDLIFDSRIRYTPYPPYKIQFRNELMLTFGLEKI